AAIRDEHHQRCYGDMAVLAPTNWLVQHYTDLLQQHGIPVEPLAYYAGETNDAVKVGTYKRSKGLEFAIVFLPRFAEQSAYATPEDAVALFAGDRFVAMTRARDMVGVGQVRE